MCARKNNRFITSTIIPEIKERKKTPVLFLLLREFLRLHLNHRTKKVANCIVFFIHSVAYYILSSIVSSEQKKDEGQERHARKARKFSIDPRSFEPPEKAHIISMVYFCSTLCSVRAYSWSRWGKKGTKKGSGIHTCAISLLKPLTDSTVLTDEMIRYVPEVSRNGSKTSENNTTATGVLLLLSW